MKKLFALLIISYSLLYSHPGRLDSSGGHRDSRTGTYHYHRSPSSSNTKERTLALYERQGEYKSDKEDIIVEIIERGAALWKENGNESKFIIGAGTSLYKQYKIGTLSIRNREYKDILLIFLDSETFTIELEKDNIYKFTKIK